MISDARGGHVSPGVYTEEREVSYSVKSLGITNLGLAGETLKGPAFQPIAIESWNDFTDYFGGTSTEKFKGTLQPKYELPYIAKEYLKESKKLQVVRVLGLSGYLASKAYVVCADFDGKKYPLVVLRSQIDYNTSGSECIKNEYELVDEWVTDFDILPYTGSSFDSNCAEIYGTSDEYPLSGVVLESNGRKYVAASEEDSRKIGKFAIKVKYSENNNKDTKSDSEPGEKIFNVSLNANDDDYIYNKLPSNPTKNPKCPLYIEAVYDYSYLGLVNESEVGTVVTLTGEVCENYTDFREPFRCAETPWFVSQVMSASQDRIEMKRLFKFYTISDGNAANYQVKISIQNIRPEAGLFDVVVRDFYDTDASPVILEKFSRCSLQEGDSNYIGLKIGTFDGGYETKSKYITVLVNENSDGIEKCVPAGFLGYPVPGYCCERANMYYNTVYDTEIKPKRQYFGLNRDTLDVDVLNYKGKDAYSNGTYDFDATKLTNGFHLDAILNDSVRNASGSSLTDAKITVDGVEGFIFSTVEPSQSDLNYKKIPRIITEDYMEETMYSDINLRKFTVYPYGGFDGWDIFRFSRTNTDDFKATRYALPENEEDKELCPITSAGSLLDLNPTLNLDLPVNAITTDYYAYLAGYRQFANPQDIEINIFATPGIDWIHNTYLVEDALDVIEDQEDGRGGDALYVVTTPQFDSFNGSILDYTEEDIADELEVKELKSSYMCTYWPWIKYFDKDEKIYVNLPATKDVIRNMAYTDNHSFPWFAPAGTSRGTVDCTRAYKKTTLATEDTLYEACVNPIKTFAEDGVIIWGNKTLYNAETPLNRVNVRRLMIRIKKLVTSASKELIFEQYDASLEKQFRSIVEPILKNVQENRGISDYRIVTECTPETRDQHILPAKILIKPINALEYISISFVVYPESVEFDEGI